MQDSFSLFVSFTSFFYNLPINMPSPFLMLHLLLLVLNDDALFGSTDGIYWNNHDGVKILVEQQEDNQCVMMLMSCHLGDEEDMTKLHCELIEKIVSLQQQYCPILHCTEYLIEPSQLHYPFDQPSQLPRYDMIELVSRIEKGKRVVQQDGLNSAAIDELLPIEAKKYLSFLRGDSETQDTQQVCGYIYSMPWANCYYLKIGCI